ncbi:hypothetical protein [Pseudomonas mosselii]|uniref:hypothetical protein n=1 Tax=Pseudomonas mosselii TaxID=78327 RepID=UPI002022EB63|nr:hypothetical protein [Pseudomonas mosselii]MCL8302314.1 hypothetical protein [Pseudomonas mosselii]
MNGGMKVGLGRPNNHSDDLRVFPQYIQNIRNIKKTNKKTQQNQVIARKNLFRCWWNRVESAGTRRFLSVLVMFRFSTFRLNRCSLSAAWPVEIPTEIPFPHVPDAPEHFQTAASPERRGLQTLPLPRVPDVLDVAGACAGFSFFAPFRLPVRCPPWPS